MPPKKKGNGEDEAETCPADMDRGVGCRRMSTSSSRWLPRNQRPPVTRFDARCTVERRGVEPEERDALIAAGALAASLTASKPDVPFLDRGAGLGLTRALTVGDERTSIRARRIRGRRRRASRRARSMRCS